MEKFSSILLIWVVDIPLKYIYLVPNEDGVPHAYKGDFENALVLRSKTKVQLQNRSPFPKSSSPVFRSYISDVVTNSGRRGRHI